MLNKKKSILKAQTLVRRKRRLFWIKVSLLIVLGIALCIGIVYLFRLDKVNIQTISVVGSDAVVPADVQAIAEADLEGNDLWVFPKHNILLYPKARIINDIKAAFPRIKSVSVSIHDWQTLVITVTERTPYALWCVNEPLFSTTGQKLNQASDCYFMDTAGYIFDQAPELSGNTYIRYYGAASDTPIGQTFSPAASLNVTDELLKGLQTDNIFITDVVTRDFDYELITNDNRQLLVNPEQDIRITLENLALVLQQSKNATSTWQYIDLRFGNKVYVKPQ